MATLVSERAVQLALVSLDSENKALRRELDAVSERLHSALASSGVELRNVKERLSVKAGEALIRRERTRRRALLRAAFTGWRVRCELVRQRLGRALAVLRSKRLLALRSAFAAWMSFLRSRRLGRRVVARLAQRRHISCFAAWRRAANSELRRSAKAAVDSAVFEARRAEARAVEAQERAAAAEAETGAAQAQRASALHALARAELRAAAAPDAPLLDTPLVWRPAQPVTAAGVSAALLGSGVAAASLLVD